ncbi:MAG: M18 family aminopeptidase [Lachnospiraceae bacterium]|nr:M18 family aminopeptidase [Lachnospiraceae bacterium]
MQKLNQENYVEGLFSFIDKSPSPFHAIEAMKEMLIAAGFREMQENKSWELEKGSSYFVVRNDSAIIAFKMPNEEFKGFHMVASHSDSPSFKIKENAELTLDKAYTKLNVEKYGGMIMSSWFDRPLSVAGRVYVNTEHGIEKKMIHFDEDLLVIPNLAIHMNRDVNNGVKYSAQTDMCPVLSTTADKTQFGTLLAEKAGVNIEDVLGQDLYLYTRQKGLVVGVDKDMIMSPRLDDLECAYSSMHAMIESTPGKFVNICAVLDNEEVGSGTRQGADSDFLYSTLKRIVYAMGGNEEAYMQAVAESFLISADNAHAVHPNHPEKADPTNRPVLNGGIVIKYSGNQKYTSDTFSGSVMKKLCMEAEVPYQVFYNHSDVLGGSTLGNISTAHVSVASVDIGLPQLAMHSAVETAGVKDVEYLVKVLKEFYKL